MRPKLFVHRYGGIGVLLHVVSALLWIVSLGAIGELRSGHASGHASLAWALGGIVSVYAAFWLQSLARRTRQRIFLQPDSVTQYICQRKEPLILFLREFGSDYVSADASSIEAHDIFVSEEERFVAQLRIWGTVLAVGRPGERLPGAGSFRIYLKDEIWQVEVGRLIEQANLIVFRFGTAPGLSWEFEQVVKRGKLSRTVFIPSSDPQKNSAQLARLIASFEVSTQTHLNVPLNTSGLHEQARAFRNTVRHSALSEEQRREGFAVAEELDSIARELEFFKLQTSVALIYVKDGKLVPVGGGLADAFNNVLPDMQLKPKLWPQIRIWLVVVLMLSPMALIGITGLLCGGEATAFCTLLNRHFVYIFLALGLVVLLSSLFVSH